MTDRDGIARRLGHPSLRAKLILFSAVLTAASVSVAFVLLSVSVRRNTRELLAGTLSHHQRTLSNLQKKNLADLLRTSALLTDDPTLRAAVETYRAEASPSAATRRELLSTIERETDRLATELGRDLLVVLDRDGRVLAASARPGIDRRAGSALEGRRWVRHVLDDDGASPEGAFAVLDLAGETYRVGSVPIVLQGYTIGALAVGERIDGAFVRDLRQTFGCDVIATAGGRVVATTAPSLGEPPLPPGGEPTVVRIGGEEFVAGAVALAPDAGGGEGRLYLVQSLDRVLDGANRSLLLLVLACGAFAAVLAVGAAAWTAGSVLRPLYRFVGFLRESAERGEPTRRFAEDPGCPEVEALRRTYESLVDSIEAHERRLVERAKDDLDRLERLKETEKLAAVGRMLSGAAHEINNPLTGVLGNVDLLLRDGSLSAASKERLERVARESRRAAALVKSLLKVSHRETGERSVVDLRALLRETAEIRKHDFAAAGIRLELDLGPDPCLALGSELELQQIALNVVHNAYDVLEGRGGSPALVLRARRQGGRVEVVFEDNGPGMRDPKQVFEPFFTTKPVGRGTGLGLSICHTVAEAHGGSMRAENREEGGARFVLELPEAPRDPSSRPPPPGVEGTPVAPQDTARAANARVLVVDDEPTIVDLQRELLESVGAFVDAVGTGAEAVAKLQGGTYDLVVTDLRMPGKVSGMDLYLWATANRPSAASRFLFVTGDTAGEAGRDFVESVGAPCLMKPFSTDEYLRAVLDACRDPRSTP